MNRRATKFALRITLSNWIQFVNNISHANIHKLYRIVYRKGITHTIAYDADVIMQACLMMLECARLVKNNPAIKCTKPKSQK